MKTVLITGAGRGLGRNLAFQFHVANTSLKEDYDLILHSKGSELPDLATEKVYGDLENFSTLVDLTEIAKEKNIDILINNAGSYLDKSFSDTTIAEYRHSIESNLMPIIFLTNLIWPIFKKKNSGLIININSMAGKTGSEGEAAYCTSKHGLRGFSESIKLEGIKNGIRIIDVYLGAMKTDMTKHRKDWNKLIDPQEAAKLIFNLCVEYKTMRVSEVTINRSTYDK